MNNSLSYFRLMLLVVILFRSKMVFVKFIDPHEVKDELV